MIRFTETDKWKDPWFRKLSPSAKVMWEYLRDNCCNAGTLEIDIDSICFHTGLKPQSVKLAMKDLSKSFVVSGNWIMLRKFLHHQRNVPLLPANNAHRPIIARLTLLEALFPGCLEDIQSQGFIRGIEAPSNGVIGPVSNGNSKGNGNSPPEGDPKDRYPAEFMVFWKAYPKKKGKPEALAAWKKLNGDPTTEALIVAIEAQKLSGQWSKDGGQFVPYPATWINKRRWEDEPDEVLAGDTKTEWQRVRLEVAQSVWDAKKRGDDLKRCYQGLRDKWKDTPKSDGKDSVTLGIEWGFNNKNRPEG